MNRFAVILFCLLSSMTAFSDETHDSKSYSKNIHHFISAGKLSNALHGIALHKAPVNSEFGTRIVGGQEAARGQFPFQISLQALNYLESYDHICGGVIYDELHILTAAHCVRGYHPNNFRVIAGAHNLESFEGTEQIRFVNSYVFHPNFDSYLLDNDIAIITLDNDNPLVFNDRVKRANILSRYLEPTGEVINSGWGNIRGDGSVENPSNLQFVNMNVVEREICEDRYIHISPVTPGMVCAADLKNGEKGACNGDSGGPLLCTSNEQQYLCGLVSWGMVPCGQSRYPSVYTNVANYLDWLQGLLPPPATH